MSPSIERLKAFYTMLDGIPAEKIDLNIWIKRAQPNLYAKSVEAACALTWAALYPGFRKHGLHIEYDMPCFYTGSGVQAGVQFFTLTQDEATELFASSNLHQRYHKSIALGRIRALLVKHNAITVSRSLQLACEAADEIHYN